jgi:hypothetical protein
MGLGAKPRVSVCETVVRGSWARVIMLGISIATRV